MAIKIFTYRGRTLDELLKMTPEEFTKLLPSRQRRSLRRGMNESQKTLLKKIRKNKPGKTIRTQVRNMIIMPEFVAKKFAIHDGKDWNYVEITPDMIGHYIGEFTVNRERVTHSGPGIGATRGTKFISVK